MPIKYNCMKSINEGDKLVNINGKEWGKLEPSDIEALMAEQDFEESFYFEFKDDRTPPKKIAKEISAFANTFGGYIFIGITDDKRIEGCTDWNEQRIHTTIHDSITPTPSFDVKKFTCSDGIVYIIKVEEGAEPPYITSGGQIFERVSSSSQPIKDSSKLSQIYSKREQQLSNMESKITIAPIQKEVGNIYGYIDIGFIVVPSNRQTAIDIFNKADLKDVFNKLMVSIKSRNLTRVGNSIDYTPGGLSVANGMFPAHANNFLEIMADGSARMRILLINNNIDEPDLNMMLPITLKKLYKDVYAYIMGELFPDKFAYAKKYESLTVLKQFNPVIYYDEWVLELESNFEEKNEKIFQKIEEYQKVMGTDIVVTDDRIPKSGLYTVDKRQLELWGMNYNCENIIDELFFSKFVGLGVIPDQKEE